ncbi:hypothetical protein [Aureimonas leprariae]|uniref:Uncharacterized protein n=1 Tax=Plantimonas leprariae TaxID=2615207 RepID=A0A7V7PMM5_9HYPH|nr:hypothetical protein [Aureimonas leprariae]KAB0678054.1 hypothetical protein F6X38_16645 [Aureimonas leprariae]
MQTKSTFDALEPQAATPSPLAAALRDVAGHFARAAIPGPDAVPAAVLGLRALAQAPCLITGEAEPNGADAVVAAICGAMNTVIDEARAGVQPESVMLGMTAALNLASLFGFTPAQNRERTTTAVVADCLDHGLLIADVLDADLRRRAIARRGEPFRRDIAIRRAVADDGTHAIRQ